MSLRGDFLRRHKMEITGLVRHEAALEGAEHVLARIMKTDDRGDELLITTTDIHLPRRIGDAVHRAYADTLDYHYEDGEARLLVVWRRDE